MDADKNLLAKFDKRMKEIINLPIEMGSSGAVCELQGWTYSDFTRTGKLGLWNISRLLEMNRHFPADSINYGYGSKQDQKSHRKTEQVEQKNIAVAGAQKTTITRHLYRLAAISCPMVYQQTIGYIGKTSISVVVNLKHKETGLDLARNEKQIIFIDLKTRRPCSVPPHIERLAPLYPPTGFVINVPPKPDDPARYYTVSMTVSASDMDSLFHTNQSKYYQFSLDAAYEAYKAGFLRNFTQDVCEYEVKETQGKHKVETFVGDEILVYVWEDETDKLTLHFEIKKMKNGAPVMFQTIKFYPLVEAQL